MFMSHRSRLSYDQGIAHFSLFEPPHAANYFAYTDYTRSVNFLPCWRFKCDCYPCLFTPSTTEESLCEPPPSRLPPHTHTHTPPSHCSSARAAAALRTSYVDQQFNWPAGNLQSNSRRSQICVEKGDSRCRCSSAPLFSGKKRSISSLLEIFSFIPLPTLTMAFLSRKCLPFKFLNIQLRTKGSLTANNHLLLLPFAEVRPQYYEAVMSQKATG